jgi:hypothetical protein
VGTITQEEIKTMKTEELNEYIFANIVNERAHKLWSLDCEKLIREEGIEVEEAMKKNPHKDTYIPTALACLNAFRKKVFEALEESEKASQQ